MMISVKAAALAAVVLGGSALAAGSASAMPVGVDPAVATGSDVAPLAQQARWVCGPYRCFWRPNYFVGRPFVGRPYGYWGRGWGWRRHW